MPCAATQTGLWCPPGLHVLQALNVVNNAPIQRLATKRLPWRQNTLRFLPIDAQAPGLLGHICRSISSRTHKHAGKRRAAIMNKTSADATRLTAPPALHSFIGLATVALTIHAAMFFSVGVPPAIFGKGGRAQVCDDWRFAAPCNNNRPRG